MARDRPSRSSDSVPFGFADIVFIGRLALEQIGASIHPNRGFFFLVVLLVLLCHCHDGVNKLVDIGKLVCIQLGLNEGVVGKHLKRFGRAFLEGYLCAGH